MICRDCQIAETDRLHPLYNALPCCDARHLMAAPDRKRREAAEKLKAGVSVEYWHELRERLDVLLEREAAAK